MKGKYDFSDKELLATMAGMKLPTVTSEIALQLTANELGVSKRQVVEMGGPSDRLRSHVHKRLQNLLEVGAVEKIEFESNDRIHLYTLPKKDDEGYRIDGRTTRQKYAEMKIKQ